jgi:hypothetical protein
VQVTAIAMATGNNFLPSALLDHWDLSQNQTALTCNNSMAISMLPIDGYGEPYAPVGISGSEASVTVSVEDGGPYVFLSALGQEGTTVATTLADGCALVFDPTRGGFTGATKVVTVTVTGGGKSGSFPVTLHCNSGLDHFQVTAMPTVVSQGMYSKLTVIAQDALNNEVFFSEDQKFDVTLSLSSITSFFWMRFWGPPPYGSLVVGDGEPQILSVQVPYDAARAGSVSYFVQSDILTAAGVDPMTVAIRAEKVGDASKNGMTQVDVVKPICVHVAFDALTVKVGESTGLQFTKADGSGGFPSDQKFVVFIESGEGTLASSTESGLILGGTSAPVRYVAPATITGSSMVASVRAFTYSSGAGTPAGLQVSTVPILKGSTLKTISKAATTQSLGKKARDAQMAAIAKLLDESACASAQVEVRKADLDHFLVTPSPDTIAHGENAKLTVLAVDTQGKEVTLDDNTPITFAASPGDYGTFLMAGVIPYSQAKAGIMRYNSKDQKIEGSGFQQIHVTASGAGKSGTGIVVLRNKSCDDAPQCADTPMLAPVISLQIQPNGFAGFNVCGQTDFRGGFLPVTKQQAVAPFSVEPCFNPRTQKWNFSTQEIKFNAIMDLCTNNLAGFRVIDDTTELQGLSYSDCLQAKKDFNALRTYPSAVAQFLIGPVLQLHETVHKLRYQGLMDILRSAWEKSYEEVQSLFDCGSFANFEIARERGVTSIRPILDDFYSNIDQEFSTRYYNRQKSNELQGDGSKNPKEAAKMLAQENATQSSEPVRVIIDDYVSHLSCK